MAAVMAADAIVLSPPCQAWSEASEGPGLLRRDGKSVLHGWGCVGMLRPDVAMMEMVGGMLNHSHFSLIRSFIQWMGYEIKAVELINANQMTPQNRDRMLMVAINRYASANRAHRFWKWPSQKGPSLQGFQSIVPLHEKWQTAIPSHETIKKYMDPKMLPKGRFGSQVGKRCKRDVISYRVRLPHDSFACLMASYGFAHEMPERILQKGGLYGSLILHEGILRFLTEPEFVIMQGAVEKQWLTSDRRANARILGNAIILPHALLGLINIYAFCMSSVDRDDFIHVFCQAMSQRMKADNIRWVELHGGVQFSKKDSSDFISDTIPMREFAKVVIQSPIEAWHCYMEFGIAVEEVLNALLGPSTPASVSLSAMDMPDCRVPMPNAFRVDSMNIVIRVDVPNALIIPIERFHQHSNVNQTVIALTGQGPVAMKHQQGMTVDDVLNVLKNSSLVDCEEGVQCFSVFGEAIDGSCIPPKCMIVASTSSDDSVDYTWQTKVVMRETEQLFHLQGPSFDLQSFLRFVEVTRCKDIVRVLGWHFTKPAFDHPQSGEESIFLTRIPGALSVLQSDLRVFISGFFSTKIIQNIKIDKDPNEIECTIKLWEQIVWKERVASYAYLRPITSAWRAITGFWGKPSYIRLVAKGKQLNPDFPVSDYIDSNSSLQFRKLKIHVVLEMRGGGPPIKDQSGLMRDGIALLYLSNGYDFKTAADVSHAFCKSATTPALQKALSQYPEDKKLKAFAALAKSLSITIPEPTKLQKDVDTKTKHRIKGSGISQPSLNVESLKIKQGYFLNQDASKVIQRSSIVPSSAGIVVMHWNEARQWLYRAESISQDELAILVVGECKGCGHGKCNKRLSVPVYDADDNPMVVSGCLHNLGCKEMRINKNEDSSVHVSASSIICFTAFRDEVDGPTWAMIQQNPVKVTLDVLVDKDESIQFPTPPWGRTWHDGKKKCKPEEAISVQYHARVSNGDLSKVLKASGQLGVYTVVKTPDKKVSQEYQVVWMEGSPIDLSLLLPKVTYHQGMVRTFRSDGRTNRGIRFLVKDFELGFAILKPGVDKPELVPANFMFRISPTPVGASVENIRQWFKSLKKTAKPIRALGDSTWLCASSEKFEDEFLIWGEDMVLVKWLAPRYSQKQSPVLASVKPISQTQSTGSSKENSSYDAIFQEDPWANWNPNARSESLQKPKIAIDAAALKPRAIEAPLEDRFKQITADVEKNNDRYDEKIQEIHNQMQDLTKRFDIQENQRQQHEASVKQEFTQIRQETAAQIQAMTDTFQQSLSSSLSKQDHQINSQFAELRNLLLQNPNPCKKAKATKPEDKEHDPDAML
eukprot:symbB.v1.2.001687.t1/scaffold93.1/size335462/2